MILQHDYFNNPVAPDYILCKSNGERIGNIICTSKTYDKKFSDISEIQFETYLYIDNEKNPIYDSITEMKYVELPDIGFFSISSVNISSEGTELECKTVTAKSYECLMTQRYLESFVVNMGTTESIDGVQFYNPAYKSRSLLHLALEKCPDWNIGHIDASLMTMQRSFEVSRQDIYSFITTDIAEAFECFFIFDTLNRTINIYAEKNYGHNTNIHVSYNNLLKNTDISCSTDDIKTCMTITGSDDITVREVNMGYDKIYNFDFYNSTEYMSRELYKAFNKWKSLRKSKLDEYNALLSVYQDYYIQINNLTHKKMPVNLESTDWTEYGLVPLKEQLSAYEQKQAASMKAGHGEASSSYYQTEYLPIYNTIQSINTQIDAVQRQLDKLQNEQNSISARMSDVIDLVGMETNFTEDQLKELSAFIREDDISSNNFVVTDTMTDKERFAMLNQMLKYGEDELYKAATPQLSFRIDMNNIFVIPDFDIYSSDFDVGNYIWVTLRDDYSVKAKLLTIHVNYYDVSDFSVTFGNIVRKSKNLFTNIQDAINEAHSAATSVSFNHSHWNQAAKDTDKIGQMIEDGLLKAGNYLSNGDDSEFMLDNRGIFVTTRAGQYADKDSIFIGGGRILFSDDNWKTVSEAIGRIDIKGESAFGVIAKAVVAGYIGGSDIEGSVITGGEIIGTKFNNGNGTFSVDENGRLTASDAVIKGTINAVSGRIGCDANGNNGFIITSNRLYNGKNSLTSAANGVYIGTDGISLGAVSNNAVPFRVTNTGVLTAKSGEIGGFTINNTALYNTKSKRDDANNGIYLGTDGISLGANSVFKVTNTGYLTSKSGEIGGAVISDNSIHSGNNNWSISSDGSAIFKKITLTDDVSINGVQSGSSFGSIGYNGTTTWGNFGGNSFFGSTANNPFSGECVKQIESLSVGVLNANIGNFGYITARDAEAKYATFENLNAVNARFNNLSADNITSGTLSADRIDSRTLIGKIESSGINIAGSFGVVGSFTFEGIQVAWGKINGTRCLVEYIYDE